MAGELLFSIGLAAMGVAVAGGVVAAVLLNKSRRRLGEKLEAEYGKRRR